MKVTLQRGGVLVLPRGEDQTNSGVHHRLQCVDLITGQTVQRGVAVVQSRQDQRGDQRLQDYSQSVHCSLNFTVCDVEQYGF